ncbi:hypothetical protein POPTR_002G250900v4 [Populus trichocarpa]|uniref:Uncharacterized protein n=1 Tax=Populus trichocarpa TaxID=3694 RepID=B9GR79_POPTR|nr:hypothetical protein BDE02_02G225400 [Populus trichocarpa]PNT51592.1 hypothetical protein POPTR_002G250900v4 [Populus trichocarpa]
MASTQVEAEPVKEVTNKAETSSQACPVVIEEKAATTEEPEVVVDDADDEEEEVKNESDEEQADQEKLEEYSPIIGEDEPNTTFDDELEAEDGDLI